MKILKIFGIVVGIHLFALILIFANPGCSSTTKTAPSPGDTASKSTPAPAVAAPSSSAAVSATNVEPASTSSAITFNPNLPAGAAPASAAGDRYSPTRPNSPVAGALLSEPVGDVMPATSYTVVAGDNLWTIARKNKITVAQLTAANNLSANASLRPGQKLLIPGMPTSTGAVGPTPGAAGLMTKSAEPLATAASSRPASDGLKHVVKPGETLGGIARKYDVRQGELAVANNISDPAKIRPGMELIIPGYKAAGSKSGKTTKSTNGKSTPSSSPVLSEPPLAQPVPAAPPPVPVLQIEGSPTTPAPK